MIVLSFKTKRDKVKMLEKARKMEEYVAEVVDCLEEAIAEEEEYDYNERSHHESTPSRYEYRRRMR